MRCHARAHQQGMRACFAALRRVPFARGLRRSRANSIAAWSMVTAPAPSISAVVGTPPSPEFKQTWLRHPTTARDELAPGTRDRENDDVERRSAGTAKSDRRTRSPWGSPEPPLGFHVAQATRALLNPCWQSRDPPPVRVHSSRPVTFSMFFTSMSPRLTLWRSRPLSSFFTRGGHSKRQRARLNLRQSAATIAAVALCISNPPREAVVTTKRAALSPSRLCPSRTDGILRSRLSSVGCRMLARGWCHGRPARLSCNGHGRLGGSSRRWFGRIARKNLAGKQKGRTPRHGLFGISMLPRLLRVAGVAKVFVILSKMATSSIALRDGGCFAIWKLGKSNQVESCSIPI